MLVSANKEKMKEILTEEAAKQLFGYEQAAMRIANIRFGYLRRNQI